MTRSIVFLVALAVCLLNTAHFKKCRPTPADVLGPFYVPHPPKSNRLCYGDPFYSETPRLVVHGTVYDEDCATKLPGTKIELWQADRRGDYKRSSKCRGYVLSDSKGGYRFTTIHPGKYAIDTLGMDFRPSHIHFRVVSPSDNNLLVTQMYFVGDSNLGANDACSSCASNQPELIVDPIVSCTGMKKKRCVLIVNFDIFLSRGHNISVVPDLEEYYTSLYKEIMQG